MENIIKKATSQGYALNKDEMNFALTTRIVCDSLFWQALGKARGWGKKLVAEDENTCLHCGIHISYQPSRAVYEAYHCSHVHYPEACITCSTSAIAWKSHALRFHEINLTEGWSKAVEYLEEVTTSCKLQDISNHLTNYK